MAPPDKNTDHTATILVLCTANQCRSPMAASLLRSELAAREMDVDVVSAGFLDGGVPAQPHVVSVMAAVGLDVSTHMSSSVNEELAATADLIVGMTRQHVVDLVAAAPEIWPRAFTAAEIVRRAQAGEPRKDTETIRAFAERLSTDRSRADLLAERLADDVPDPIGGRKRDFERVRDLLAAWAADLAIALDPNRHDNDTPP